MAKPRGVGCESTGYVWRLCLLRSVTGKNVASGSRGTLPDHQGLTTGRETSSFPIPQFL